MFPFKALVCLVVLSVAPGLNAQEAKPSEPPMTVDRLGEIMTAIDPEAEIGRNGIRLTVDRVPVTIITDAVSNRMRILVPVASAEALDEADMRRMMQANFDTALDARYAIANGRLWSVFIHPLAELESDQVVSGLAQTVVLARNYGGSYASGGTVFGSGDSVGLYQELLDLGEEL